MLKNLDRKVKRDWIRNRSLYLLVIPVVLFYIIFAYKPMYGALIAFKDYTPALGFAKSPWVGMDNFKRFFNGIYFGRLFRNTVLLSLYNLLFGFPAPIILALMLNEVICISIFAKAFYQGIYGRGSERIGGRSHENHFYRHGFTEQALSERLRFSEGKDAESGQAGCTGDRI